MGPSPLREYWDAFAKNLGNGGLASLSAYGTICVDSGTVFAKSMTYCVMAGNWDFTRKAFPILSPEPFSAVKFTLPI